MSQRVDGGRNGWEADPAHPLVDLDGASLDNAWCELWKASRCGRSRSNDRRSGRLPWDCIPAPKHMNSSPKFLSPSLMAVARHLDCGRIVIGTEVTPVFEVTGNPID